jgi:hypothetical protein
MPLTDLQCNAGRLRRHAEDVLAAVLARHAALDGDRRCEGAIENLAPAARERWAAISAQLGGGNGGELRETGGHRPKFCSAFSSCALAVNTFAPFLDRDRSLPIPRAGVFGGDVQFEAQRSAGVRGYKPNLDLVCEPADGDWLFAESKCLEYLRPHTTAFSDAFVTKARNSLLPETSAFYAVFAQAEQDERPRYELVDGAQLLKHFLAAKRAAGEQRSIVLVYLFWEPADAAVYPIFGAHRREADDLAVRLVDDQVRLLPISYPQLWSHWENDADPGLAAHIEAVRERYDLALGVPA